MNGECRVKEVTIDTTYTYPIMPFSARISTAWYCDDSHSDRDARVGCCIVIIYIFPDTYYYIFEVLKIINSKWWI